MNAQSQPPRTGDTMISKVIAGCEVVFDREGFLIDFDDWSEKLFEILAKESGLMKVDDRHWRVIRFLREYYEINGRTPLNRQLCEGAGMNLTEIKKLFPDGIKHGARRLAGLPNPRDCM